MYEEFIKRTDIKEFAKYIDHTLLKPQLTVDDVKKAINDYRKYNFCLLYTSPSPRD